MFIDLFKYILTGKEGTLEIFILGRSKYKWFDFEKFIFGWLFWVSDLYNDKILKRYADCNASIKEMNSYRDGYIHGMTEKLEGIVPIEKACEWITEHIDIPYEGEFIDDIPVDYVEYLSKRLEYAKAVADAFKQAMEE
jgi:hypothetical protein